jgi:mRNA interferase RelE/StbE
MLSLPREAQAEVARAIDLLIENPRPSGCKKLREYKLWLVRVGRYRVVYTIDDETRLITVVKVAVRREDTYRRVG